MAKKKSKRDEFRVSTKRVLAFRVGTRCSKPDCRKPTTGEHSNPDKFLNLGEAAHITAAAENGPRYDSSLSPAERKSAENGIWLCNEHAQEVDADDSLFSVELLHSWKSEAEACALEDNPSVRPAGALPPIWNVPHSENPNFTGREELLDAMESGFGVETVARNRQAIHGMAGVGKTQLALEYIYQHLQRYNIVWWISAEHPSGIDAAYTALARSEGLAVVEFDSESIIKAVKDWLDSQGNWLLVFDNAPDCTALKSIVPQSKSGHVLITSRNPNWKQVAEPLEVSVWPPGEAVAYLCDYTGQPDRIVAEELADELGYLPLALAQAAGYIESTQRSVRDYLDLFRTRRCDLWEREQPPNDYERTVATCWNLTAKELQRGALELLQLCAFLGPEMIPRSLPVQGAEYLPKVLQSAVTDELMYDECVECLRSFSLIEASTDSLAVHRLLQAVVRDDIDEQTRRAWAEIAVRLLQNTFPYKEGDLDTWVPSAELLPHAIAAVDHAESQDVAWEESDFLLNHIGRFQHSQGRFFDARTLHMRAIEIAERAYDASHPAVAIGCTNLASVERDLGHYKDARKLIERAIAIEEKTYAAENPTLAVSYAFLGLIEHDLGDLDKARKLYVRALAINKKAYKTDHPLLAISHSNLAMVEQDLGCREEACKLFKRAISIYKETDEGESPTLAVLYSNLASVEMDLGRPDEACQLLERALTINEKVYEPNHPALAVNYSNLAMVKKDLGQLKKAHKLLEHAIVINEQAHKAEHPALAFSYSNLATVKHALGQVAEARKLMRQGFAIWHSRLGINHPSTQRAVAWLLEHDPDFEVGPE